MNMNNQPTLQDVIKYLQDRPHMILQEKNAYQADRLMMMLDNEKLAALEQEFNEHPNGIELPNFIWLMKCAISHSPEDKYELVNGLIKLFQDIDINGDGHMEWAEFTQYIIDAVIGSKDAQLYDARFERDRDMTELEVLDRAYSRKSKRYIPMQQMDNSNHKTLIKNIAYSLPNDSVICLEQNSSFLKFYSSDCQEKRDPQNKTFSLQPPQDEGRIFILHFSVTDNIIAAVTSDRKLIFWENALQNRIIKSFRQDVLQTGIWWFPYHEMWVTAGADYNIRAWDVHMNSRESPGTVIKFLGAHMEPITDIVELVSPKMLASASHDGKIKLWDMQDQKLITELKSPYPSKRGVLGLSYNRDYGSNLLSFGFEIYINVWCPEVSITRAYIGRLEGHSTLVVACKFIPASPNCISIDDRTNIRIWDIRTMSTVQVLPNDQPSIVTDICVITKSDRFVYSGKRLNYFYNASQQSTKQKVPNEDAYPIAVEFNQYYNIFVVLTKMDIRIYDAMSGKMRKVLNEIFDEKTASDLSNVTFGGRQRKFFVSDNAGLIRQYNMKNGEFLKKVNMHNEIEKSEFANKLVNVKKKDTLDITAMIFLHEEKLLISGSLDSTIRIYDETDPEESVLLKVFCGGNQNSEILSMAYSLHFTMLATGSGNGLISLWDFETSKLCGVLFGQGEVAFLEFSDPYPILISVQGHHVNVWHIKQNRCLVRLQSIYPLTSLAVISEQISGPFRLEPMAEFNTPFIEAVKKPKINIQEEIEQFQRDLQLYDSDRASTKRRLLVYVGDNKGLIHLISLTEYLTRKQISEMEKPKKGQSYQLKRKDLVDASKSVETYMVQDEKSQNILVTCNMNSMLIRQWVAHTASIVRINKIKEPLSIVTSSLDKHFKIWSERGELYSDINLVRYGDNLWQFPFDWVGQKLKDIELVFDALKLIEKENLTEAQKEQAKVRYLMNKYFNDQAVEDLMRMYNHITEPVIVAKEKRKVQQSQSQQLLPMKSVTEDLIRLNQKIKDDLQMKQRMRVPEPEIIHKPPSPHGLVQKLIAAFSDQKPEPIVEESIVKKKVKPKRDLPQLKQQSKMSSQKFQQTSKFIQAQLTRPHSQQIKFVNDIKYQSGESIRAMKMTTYQNYLKFQSNSNQMAADNEILQMKCQFYKQLHENLEVEDDEELLDEDEKQLAKKSKTIVATSNFLNNAKKNKHKVLKTKNKIFVNAKKNKHKVLKTKNKIFVI